MGLRAVIFDLGGVVVGSPLHAIADFERDLRIPAGFINRVVVTTAPGGAWSQLERGEVTLEEFYSAFEEDCAAAGVRLSARALMERVGAATVPRPQMLTAIERLRAAGIRTGALTNNWIAEEPGTRLLRPYFDVFVESAVVGMRKPDPRIFLLACAQLGVTPAETVFLDDIGLNLKAARALGMSTIKVADPDGALAALEGLLGLALREPRQ
jgi:epoxide hydrolase-like predicted phosphatase